MTISALSNALPLAVSLSNTTVTSGTNRVFVVVSDAVAVVVEPDEPTNGDRFREPNVDHQLIAASQLGPVFAHLELPLPGARKTQRNLNEPS